ncbi:MAG: rRNA maturation RNase YbeY [Synergistaceae bacterium]|nr:rRNA maturation RNase YbeY [Synergistaceae bacterium]
MNLRLNVSEPEEGGCPIPPGALKGLERVLGEEFGLLCDCPEAELSLSFLNALEMREVNKEHRGIDEATDVLAFPLWEGGCFEPSFGLLPLGDVLICPEEAEREHSLGHSGALCLVLAHGFLHLLGWDHDTPEGERAMWERQDILKARLLAAWEVQ